MKYCIIIDSHGCTLKDDILIVPKYIKSIDFRTRIGESCYVKNNEFDNYNYWISKGFGEHPYVSRKEKSISLEDNPYNNPIEEIITEGYIQDMTFSTNPSDTYETMSGGFLNRVVLLKEDKGMLEIPIEDKLSDIINTILLKIEENFLDPDPKLNIYINACRVYCDEEMKDYELDEFSQFLEESFLNKS